MLDNQARLVDVFLTGPLQIYVSTLIPKTDIFFKYFMLLTGVLNILYNGHNYLLFNYTLKQPLDIFKPFVSNHGKHQFHRLYNLLIMYPIFIYIALKYNLPNYIQKLFILNIIVGIIYNLYYYINL
jgi:hypothetical protein